jgi:MFS family permease
VALMREDEGATEAVSIPISEMFNQKYKESSIRLLSSWFSVCFIYYGVMILLPSILQRVFSHSHTNQNFKYLFIVVISIVEVASFYLSSKIMDHPKIGRKRSVYYGFAAIFFVTALILLCGEENKVILFTAFVVIKFVASATFMVLQSPHRRFIPTPPRSTRP